MATTNVKKTGTFNYNPDIDSTTMNKIKWLYDKLSLIPDVNIEIKYYNNILGEEKELTIHQLMMALADVSVDILPHAMIACNAVCKQLQLNKSGWPIGIDPANMDNLIKSREVKFEYPHYRNDEGFNAYHPVINTSSA